MPTSFKSAAWGRSPSVSLLLNVASVRYDRSVKSSGGQGVAGTHSLTGYLWSFIGGDEMEGCYESGLGDLQANPAAEARCVRQRLHPRKRLSSIIPLLNQFVRVFGPKAVTFWAPNTFAVQALRCPRPGTPSGCSRTHEVVRSGYSCGPKSLIVLAGRRPMGRSFDGALSEPLKPHQGMEH